MQRRAGGAWETGISPRRGVKRPVLPSRGSLGWKGSFCWNCGSWRKLGWWAFPTPGKSTLLTAISKARPKVAPYPFTTLHPQVGIVEYADFHRLTVCDVPGLIEGAHRNAGLGHKFLRHIERCKVLVLVVDMAGTDGRNPCDDYKQLLAELKLYDPALLEKPRLVAANKMDEPAAEANLRKFKRKARKIRIVPMAAAFDEGIEPFKSGHPASVQRKDEVEGWKESVFSVARTGSR